MSKEINWVAYEVSEFSPLSVLDEWYKGKPDSYKTYGKLGDTVIIMGLNGFLRGKVIALEGNDRTVETGETVWFQEWVHDKYWIDMGGGNLKGLKRILLKDY